MNNESMDRLFREGADKYEVKPSAAAWEAIQDQVGNKASVWPMVWKVAAVLVVVLSSVIVLFNGEDQKTESLAAGIVDHPQRTEKQLDWNLPVIDSSSDQALVQKVSKTSLVQVKPEEKLPVLIETTGEMRAYLELQRKSLAWEIKMPAKPTLFTSPVEETSVKIRYYASTSEPEKTKKSFGQFIARAQQKLSPDELLADIRTAKDDLFRSNRGD